MAQDGIQWRAAYCGVGLCLEVAQSGGVILVRESGNPDKVIEVSQLAWETFLAAAKRGDFDAL